MKVHRVLQYDRSDLARWDVDCRTTHRTTARTARHDNVDDRVRLEIVDAALGQEFLCGGIAAQDLQQDGDRWSSICDIVDGEAGRVILQVHVSRELAELVQSRVSQTRC